MCPPNLLFLYTDEQRADTMAAYGNTKISMPNLNRLAEESTVFEKTYVTQPVCTPSRSTLLTGLTPHTNGCVANNIPLPVEVSCVPEMLPEMYTCAHHGKWHLGDEIFPQHGFTEWRAIEDAYTLYYSAHRDQNERSHYHHWLMEHGFNPDPRSNCFSRDFCARLPEKYCKPRYLALEASRFIRENRSRPWVLYVNFLEPHMPFYSCRNGQYDPADIELPENFMHEEYDIIRARALAAKYFSQGLGLPLRTQDDWKRMIANYWGMCSLVDTYVGKILQTLADCGLDDNTIVVFTSDHGDMMGSHRLIAKTLMYEEAVRVPFLLRMPGQRDQQRIMNPVSQLDIVPTLLDLMGADIDDSLEGQSLKPVLAGRETLQRDVIIEWNGQDSSPVTGNCLPEYLNNVCSLEEARASFGDPVRTIVTPDNWKLCCSPLGEHMLFDLNKDPHEMNNLARDPSWTEKIQELTKRIRAWQDRTGDTVEV